MEKEFTPYELALELKELGFDEPCFGYWSNWAVQEPFLLTCELGKEIESASINRKNILFKAPTFSQAFRWFREKYNGVCEITRKEDGNHSEFMGWIFIDNKRINIVSYWDSKTYEEVELECLKKLIEIVKGK